MKNGLFDYNSRLMRFLNYVGDMIQLNVYWLLGSLTGLIVFGLFPSTKALVSVLRDRIYGKNDALTRPFISYYKQNFWRTNIKGYSFFGGLVLLLVYLRMAQNIQNSLSGIFIWLSYGLFVMYILIAIYVLILSVHLTHPTKVIIKYSIVLMVSCPIHTLLVIIVIGVFIWSIKVLPMFLSVLSIALLFDLITRIIKHCQFIIIKVQRSKEL